MTPISTALSAETRHTRTVVRIAALVLVGDLLTKAAAVALLGADRYEFTQRIALMVVHNDVGAFGWSAGAYTWQLNVALTLAAVIFAVPVARDLGQVDRAAPKALGLIVGGALGNLISQLTSPYGVVDFISLSWAPGHALVWNAADIAAYCGLALILRTGVRIVRAMVKASRDAARQVVGSAYHHKATAKRTLRRMRIERLPHAGDERVVVDWSHVTELPARGVVATDTAPAETAPEFLDIEWDPPRLRTLPRPRSFQDLTRDIE